MARQGGVSTRAAIAVGGAALSFVFVVLSLSSHWHGRTVLLHVGPLARQQNAIAAAEVKQRGLPDVDELDVDAGIGFNAGRAAPRHSSAHDGHAYHRSDDSDAMANEIRTSAKHIGLLAKRDADVQNQADKAADSDLEKYNTGIAASLDEYSRISKSIDAQSRMVFNPPPKRHVRPAIDPFKDDENAWSKMGLTSDGDVFGVPHEFSGMKAVSYKHAELHPDEDLPDFVRRAEAAAQRMSAPGEGNSVSEAAEARRSGKQAVQAQMARAAEAARHRARREGSKQQVVSMVRQAVQKALKDNLVKKEAAQQQADYPTQVAAFTAPPDQQPQQPAGAVWAQAVPVRISPVAVKHPAASAPKATHKKSEAEEAWLRQAQADRRMYDEQQKQQRVQYVKQLAQAYERQLEHPAPKPQQKQQQAQAQDHVIADGEAEEVAKLKAEVKKMREEQRVEKLRRQVHKLKASLQSRQAALHASTHSPPSSSAHRTHSTLAEEESEAPAAPEGEEEEGNEAGAEGATHEEGEEEEGSGQEHEEGAEHQHEEHGAAAEEEEEEKKAEPKRIKICDGMGCYFKTATAPPKPQVRHHPSTKEGIKQALEGGVDLGQLVFPWEHTWTSEVHLDDNGEIRADHDDPHSRLMPHDEYQNAEYPEGDHSRDAQGKGEPGVTNEVGTHLFSDNIVHAAPGFNSGLGRHTRAQEASDWERNWETERESNSGLDEHGRKIVVK